MIKLIGDTHGRLSLLEKELKSDKITKHFIHVGDFGYYMDVVNWMMYSQDERLRVLPGNHDPYDIIRSNAGARSLYLPSFGFEKMSGLNVFWIKGAQSIDTDWPTRRRPIFDAEQLTQREFNECTALYDSSPKIDLMVTHTAPLGVVPLLVKHSLLYCRTSEYLQRLLEYKPPKNWVFGHFHKDFKHKAFGTNFRGLGLSQIVSFSNKGFKEIG